jgi:hypothetical protein
MPKMINLEKKGIHTLYGNGLMLTIELEDDNKIIATIESEKGNQRLDIHPHNELENTIVFELLGGLQSDGRPKFTVI